MTESRADHRAHLNGVFKIKRAVQHYKDVTAYWRPSTGSIHFRSSGPRLITKNPPKDAVVIGRYRYSDVEPDYDGDLREVMK
jgi:hypothetical protein